VESKSLNNQVYGVIAHIPVPFHLPEADGCKLGAACPIKNGDTITESVTLPILAEYPKVNFGFKVFD
jgi:Niemann-Pick C2 protein